MNALRRERDDDDLSTADLLKGRAEQGTRDVRDAVDDGKANTPRQVYNATHEPSRTMPRRDRDERNPPDYIPPDAGPAAAQPVQAAGRGPQVVPTQVPPAGPLADVPARRDVPGEHAPVGQSLSHAVDQPTTHPIGQPGVVTDRQVRSEQLWPPVAAGDAKPQPVQAPAPRGDVAPVPAAPSSSVQTSNAPAGQAVQANNDAAQNALFPEDELHNYRARWNEVQTSFVDEPRKAVQNADHLVASVVKRIAEQFANERENLEKQWDRGDDVNTEELRQTLRRYRAFFDRLLSV